MQRREKKQVGRSTQLTVIEIRVWGRKRIKEYKHIYNLNPVPKPFFKGDITEGSTLSKLINRDNIPLAFQGN